MPSIEKNSYVQKHLYIYITWVISVNNENWI